MTCSRISSLALLALSLIASPVCVSATEVNCCTDASCGDCPEQGVLFQNCMDNQRPYVSYVDDPGSCTLLTTAYAGDCCKYATCSIEDCEIITFLGACDTTKYPYFFDFYGTERCSLISDYDPDAKQMIPEAEEKPSLAAFAAPATAAAPADHAIATDDSGADGDPHIKSWSGEWFDYQGECDIVLLQAPNFEAGKLLAIHIRTTIRYGYSFIESAALSIADDILEVSSFGVHSLNGVESALAPEMKSHLTIAGYPIYHSEPSEKQHKFDVVVGTNENITLSTFKDLVGVKISHGTARHFGRSVGIMGSFPDGKLVTRDGTTVLTKEQANDFGQEWQVRADEPMLFRTVRAPQAPHQKCILPSEDDTAAKQKRRRLGEADISRQAAVAACSRVTSGDDKLEACVMDVLAIGDLDIARAGAY